MTPRILLADCDQMFVAVARLVDPEGAGRARLLVVGGRPGSRGVVCSASYEVRKFGVRSGMPIARAQRLCPDATFVPVPRGACGEKARAVRAALERWAPVVAQASIDEFFLDLTGTEAVYRHEPLARTAERIRRDVVDATGLMVSIGGGTNRLVAKLAAERAKPGAVPPGSGVLIVPPGEEPAFLATHALAELPGVGPRLQAGLAKYGLTRVTDALRVDRRTLESWLGPGTGAWLHDRIRGLAGAAVAPDADSKSMSHENTFERDLAGDAELETELLRLVTRLAAEVRRAGLRASRVTVKLRDHDFRTRQAGRTLPGAIDSDRALFTVAVGLLRRLRAKRRTPARLLGVALSRFQSDHAYELDLIDDRASGVAETSRDRRLAAAMDRVNAKFGRQAIEPARLKEPRRSPG